jgi:hypothetical protein
MHVHVLQIEDRTSGEKYHLMSCLKGLSDGFDLLALLLVSIDLNFYGNLNVVTERSCGTERRWWMLLKYGRTGKVIYQSSQL